MDKAARLTTPGINVRWPWSELIASGAKTVETRGYAFPEKYLGKPIAIIETGRKPSPEMGSAKSMMIALVRVNSCFKYQSEKEWRSDFARHRVEPGDKLYSFTSTTEKWGWEIELLCRIDPSVAAPTKKGIKYASRCLIPTRNLSGLSIHVAGLIQP